MTSVRGKRLCLAQQSEADELLSRDPFALLVGMLLDQQIPMERAFAGPVQIAARMEGSFDPCTVAAYDPDGFVEVVAGPPAVHRFPTAMAARIQTLAKHLDEEYGGNAAAVWADVKSGDDLLARLSALPGFGAQKAKIFVALLGKQMKVRPRGWRGLRAVWRGRRVQVGRGCDRCRLTGEGEAVQTGAEGRAAAAGPPGPADPQQLARGRTRGRSGRPEPGKLFGRLEWGIARPRGDQLWAACHNVVLPPPDQRLSTLSMNQA